MKELIYNKLYEYDPNLKEIEISYSNRPLILDELISLYKMRNKLAKDENIKELTLKILNDLILIKKNSIQYIKFVIVRENGISKLFFFSEDYSKIFQILHSQKMIFWNSASDVSVPLLISIEKENFK